MILNRDLTGTRGNENNLKLKGLEIMPSYMYLFLFLAKGFIKESGRSELPGRPILYETTNEFLDYFGLSSVEDLPNIEDIIQEAEDDGDDNSDLYTSKYMEIEEKNE